MADKSLSVWFNFNFIFQTRDLIFVS